MSPKRRKKKLHEMEDLVGYESGSGVSMVMGFLKYDDVLSFVTASPFVTASQGFASQMGVMKSVSSWGIEQIRTGKTYDTTAMSQDMTELMSVAHRTESKVDETMTIVKKIAEKLDIDSDENSVEVQSTLDIDDNTAERMIIEYLQQNENVFPSDLADALSIDIDQVARVLQKLEREGVIGTNE